MYFRKSAENHKQELRMEELGGATIVMRLKKS